MKWIYIFVHPVVHYVIRVGMLESYVGNLHNYIYFLYFFFN